MNTKFLAAMTILTLVTLGASKFHVPQNDSPILNLCANHGGLAQSQGVGNGSFQQLGYECQDGTGGKISVK